MIRLAWRRRPGEQPDPDDHRGHAEDLPPPDVLSEHAGADAEQHHEAHRERRLDQRQRDEHERADLGRPATQSERRPQQPARPLDQADEQRDAEVLLLRRVPRLQRLQTDRRGIEDRCREGENETGDDVHRQPAR
jgi:hypothetical protein